MTKNIAFDIEVLPNYFLIVFYRIEDGTTIHIATSTQLTPDEIKSIKTILDRYHVIGFNSLRYDLPIIMYALRGYSVSTLYKVSCSIVENDVIKPYKYNELKSFVQNMNHQDLMFLQNQRISLKTLGARIHVDNIMDMPIDPHIPIDLDDKTVIDNLLYYCINDCKITGEVWKELQKEETVRLTLNDLYPHISHMGSAQNMKDAALCENIICSHAGLEPQRGINMDFEKEFKYVPPKNLKFDNWYLQQHMKLLSLGMFQVQENTHKIVAPDYYKTEYISYGGADWNIGIGGIHTREKSMAIDIRNNRETILLNFDVSAFYPSMLLNIRLGPNNWDKKQRFLTTLAELVAARKKAKADGNKPIADALKVPLNAITGKLNSKYSIAYNPHDYIRMTVSGQLYMLRLAEMLFTSCPSAFIISANTDGIVVKCRTDEYSKVIGAGNLWCQQYGFELDVDVFSAIYARDVNNYFALDVKGVIKKKGFFAELSTRKVRGESNPMATICNDAVIMKCIDNLPIERSIHDCNDITKFLFVQNIRRPGAKWRDIPLGRTVRFIWSTEGERILRVSNDYKVPRSDGAVPYQELPNTFPEDIDYGKYVAYAKDIHKSVGGLNVQNS